MNGFNIIIVELLFSLKYKKDVLVNIKRENT